MRLLAGLIVALALASNGAVAPSAHAEGEHLAILEARLQHIVDTYTVPGQYAVAITDLQTGETIGVNSETWQLAGCSINLGVIALATLEMQGARLDPEVVDPLIATTIHGSNPVTAHDLYELTGRGEVRAGLQSTAALLRRVGMSRTILDHAPGYSESIAGGSDNWTTARDANRLLEWIWNTRELAPDWRAYLLDRMTNVKPGLNYLMASVPGVVSHKNGFLATTDALYVDNDIAIVRLERGGVEYAYAISFFSQGVDTKYADIPLGQEIAHEAWAFFTARYP